MNISEIPLLNELLMKKPQLYEKCTKTREKIIKTIDFYRYCETKIIRFNKILITNPELILSFYENDVLQKSFGFNELNQNDIVNFCINNKSLSDIDISNKTEYSFTKTCKKFPNTIVDLLNTKKSNTNILMKYIWNILDNASPENSSILLNRIYRFKLNNGREFIIQILFVDNIKSYWTFIFEYFENINQYLQNYQSYYGERRVQILDTNSIEFLRLTKEEICVCVSYRDFKGSKIEDIYHKSEYHGYANDTGIYYKSFNYTETYLMTSDAYTRNNFLSILFLLYGMVLKYIEQIYDYNNYGIPYSQFIILSCINATGIEHKKCPYCQLGFTLARKGLITKNKQLYNVYSNNLYQNGQSLRNKLIQNKDIKRIDNNLKFVELQNNTNIYSTSLHYFNPAKHELDKVVYDIILTSKGKGKLGIDLVLETDFIDVITSDLISLREKNYINNKFIQTHRNIIQHQLLKNMY